MASGDDSLPIGYLLSGYRIEKVLGRGGFGVTYLAREVNLDLLVAIKEYFPRDYASRSNTINIRPSGVDEDKDIFNGGLLRFLEEAKTIARFRHPNIVTIKQFFKANGTAYLVMEYCEGRPLDQIIKSNEKIPQAALETIWYLLLSGLERVHAAGVLHRDIKPANIFIQKDWSPILLDFGSSIKAATQKTRDVTTLVADGYSPMEQYDERKIQGPYTDIYGLASTLYRVVTGIKPLLATSRVYDDDVVPAAIMAKGRYSERLLASIDAGMAVLPQHRPQNVAQWRAMIGGAASRTPPPPPQPKPKPRSSEEEPAFFGPVSGDADATSATPPIFPNNPGPPELEEIWRNLRKNATGWVSVTIGLTLMGVLFIYSSTNDSGKPIGVEVSKPVQVTPVPESSPISAQVTIQDCADCPEMQLVKGGAFIMGSDTAGPSAQPAHEVQVGDFYISKWPITRKQWNYYVQIQKDIDPDLKLQDVRDITHETLPATEISWFQAKGYAEWLATEYKGTYRLMSEAEWEYAARAGSSTKYFFGDDESQLGEYAWHSANSGGVLHSVAQKKPNQLGLYDVYGPVLHWVKDCWHDNYVGAPKSAIPWISEGCKRRVLRGGWYELKASEMQSASRWRLDLNESVSGLPTAIRVARGP